MADKEFTDKVTVVATELAVRAPELVAVGGLTLAASKVVMSYAVPFIAQLGFGASVGTSLGRSLLVGTTDLGVAAVSNAVVASVRPSLLAGTVVVQPVATGAVYTILQLGFSGGEGAARDFTFATLSSATSTMLSGGLALTAASSLFSARQDKRLKK